MVDCATLIHPFQNDPGVSQRQRIMDDLLAGSAKIDGRSLPDLLDYFVQLSRHVNYYDTHLNISDWQPFFQKSVPFTLAAIIKYNRPVVSEKIAVYSKLFDKKSSKSGLQLLIHYQFWQVINKINGWHLQLKDSGLQAEIILEKLIRDKLRIPLAKFICYHNLAVRLYCVKPLDFHPLSQNAVWDLNLNRVDPDCKPKGKTKRQRLVDLQDQVHGLAQTFLDAIRIVADVAAQNIEQSLVPLKEEMQKNHTPHLALLFAFLKLFQHLQADLNTYTKKHLDFFYKEVLKLKAREAVPDKVHIVFEIQKQLDVYFLKRGLLLKDGKDNNKAEILFALDDEIVVNKTQVVEKRTLFLNNQDIVEKSYVEGVYMAPKADKVDGLEQEFADVTLKSFPTLGAKYSKYKHPEQTEISPYPNARIGFIMASPVLLLNEGVRTVDITLACSLKEDLCEEMENSGVSPPGNCCDENVEQTTIEEKRKYPDLIDASLFYDDVTAALNETYYYINVDVIREAVKKGINKTLEKELRDFLIEIHTKYNSDTVCYCPIEIKKHDTLLNKQTWQGFYNGKSSAEKLILDQLIKPRRAMKISFSGEEKWIEPKLESASSVTISPGSFGGNKFLLKITARLEADQPAVTFYDKDTLKEDFNTTDPVVKVELDDKIKLVFTTDELESKIENNGPQDNCCLLKETPGKRHEISLYHFFRNVSVLDTLDEDPLNATRIDVKVCGLKNFIVQNDESVQDVNSPIYPFGTRPKVIDFDIKNPLPNPLPDPPPNLNLVGPNFYIGSKEVFCKKWNDVYVNLKWKDKPLSFNDYYDGYIVRDNYHDCDAPDDNTKEIYGLNECDFQMNLAVLENGNWMTEKLNSPHTSTIENKITKFNNRLLFESNGPSPFCNDTTTWDQAIRVFHNSPVTDPQFDLTQEFNIVKEPFLPYNVNSRNGFFRINLQNQDFLHKDYSYVLARQMMAFGRYPDLVNGAVYRQGGVPQVFDISVFFGNIGPKVIEVASDVVNSAITGILDELIQIITDAIDDSVNQPLLNQIISRAQDLLLDIAGIAGSADIADFFLTGVDVGTLTSGEQTQINDHIRDFVNDLLNLLKTDLTGIEDELKAVIRNKFDDILVTIDTGGFFSGLFGEKEVIIPNEPWTPIIKNISIDYTATAANTDIGFIHLYPYEGTYKAEELTLQPTLLPTFCEEGNLFLGLKDLVPGSNVNMLFQMAEATADSEADREDIFWHYLDNNQWKSLRNGFEILDDATDGLTTSGIVRFAIPGNISKENTILPKGMHWIRASIPKSSKTVSETIGVYTQAIRATFTNDTANDKLRLSKPLEKDSVSRLHEADASLKKLNQPFDSFGGRIPEMEGHFYVRVSELLRHKGRAIQKFDYERLALELFPQLFKVKCINHSFGLNAYKYKNDFPVAPGYVLLAVIPDLNQLKAAQSFEPRVPVSMLDDLQEQLKKITSPFVRFRAMNPRYEKIHFCLSVQFVAGKDVNYYKEKMKQDLREFLAPWAIGEYEKLTFGQCVSRSEIIQFLETRDYVDYILELLMRHNDDHWPDKGNEEQLMLPVCPKTPRSILIAGEIDVCIPERKCEEWGGERNADGILIDPCKNKKIPIAEYCGRNIPG